MQHLPTDSPRSFAADSAAARRTPQPPTALERLALLMASVVTATALAACGGGGSDAPSGAAPSPAPAPAPTPAPAPAPSPAPSPAPAPAPAPATGTALTGTIRGPIAAEVVLQNNGGDDLTATVVQSVGVTDRYDETPFVFATKLLDGAAYQVSIKTAPADQTCSVYKGAAGTMPVAATTLRVGCEITNDLVSRSTNDAVKGTFFDSSAPVIGGSVAAIGATTQGYGEGRFVAFVSNAAGMAGTTSAHRQVFWRDRLTGETRLVSATAAGAEGNDDSWAPAISADGLVVVFESYASNLVANDTNAVRDVFGWSAQGGTVERLSVGAGGVEANAASFSPTVSGDGRVVAFMSGASNLTPGVSGINEIHVIRRDVVAATNKLISVNASGVPQEAGNPVLSEDGNRLAFSTFWPLLPSDTNNLWDIYVYDHAGSSLQRVSLTSTGGERNQGTESASRSVAPAISGDGRYVAYATTATNVVPGDTNGVQDVFVVDTQTGAVARASVDSAGAQGSADSPSAQGERPALSADGQWVAFSTSASNLGAPGNNAVMHNMVTGETRVLSSQTSSSVGPVAMSRTGAYAVFGAGAPLDSRFASSGLFARFTGVARSWWWID
ncbi:MAG: hypothetical protein ABI702_07180 [Burkholderiales bacterium]